MSCLHMMLRSVSTMLTELEVMIDSQEGPRNLSGREGDKSGGVTKGDEPLTLALGH